MIPQTDKSWCDYRALNQIGLSTTLAGRAILAFAAMGFFLGTQVRNNRG